MWCELTAAFSGDAGRLPGWEVELVSAILEALSNEVQSEEVGEYHETRLVALEEYRN